MRVPVIVSWLAVLVCASVLIVRAGSYHERFGAPAAAIAGGVPADYRRYPWFVSMLTRGGKGHCGGTLINPTTVLSAKHCEVVKGQAVIIGGTEVRTIASITRHPVLDLMLIKLTQKSSRQPIKTVATSLPPANTPVVVLGRGGKLPGSAEPHTQFTKTFLSTLSRDQLNQILSSADQGFQQTIQGQRAAMFGMRSPWLPGIRGACSGDSGDPIIREKGAGMDELVGVIVAGSANAFCENVGDRTTIGLAVPDVSRWLKTAA